MFTGREYRKVKEVHCPTKRFLITISDLFYSIYILNILPYSYPIF
jgi:hypothetical protein